MRLSIPTQLALLSFGLIILDRGSKSLAISAWQTPRVLIPGWLHLDLFYNQAIGFYWQLSSGVTIAIIITALLVFAYLMRHNSTRPAHALLYITIAVGALSNLYDRLVYPGVIDFIRIPFWSVFNLADIYILAGVCGILWLSWKDSRQSGRRIDSDGLRGHI